MSIWKTISQNDFTTETIQVHKEFNLDSSSYGQSFIQFKSGSSSDFPANQSGSYWDSNRVHFYLSGSQFDFSSTTSSYHGGNMYSSPGLGFGLFDSKNPQHLNKFYSTGSTLSITQQYFGNGIRRKSFELTDNSHPSGTVVIQDDGYGNLYAPSASISSSGTSALSSSVNYVGNIFYNLGIINITETGSFDSNINYTTVGTGLDGGIGSGSYTFKFESTVDINTREYILKVKKQDFNYTNNLTCRKFGTTSGSAAFNSLFDSKFLRDDILSSSLSGSWGPMMNTIGFYREVDGIIDNHPIVVARYPQSIMMRGDIDLIFKIRMDF